MSWQSIRGHDRVVEKFRRAIAKGRLASTFLFVGLPGIGKRSFALQLAQSVLCERVPEAQLQPCGECPSCHQVASGNHPDLILISKPADKAFIPLKLLIGEDETRMREGLCYDLASKPYSGRRKIAIIDDADYLNKEGANCLLKTLEEPPPRSLLILMGTSEQRQLPTIRSRCQIVRFQPLAADEVAALLMEKGLCPDAVVAKRAAEHSEGSLERAVLWLDESVREFRQTLLDMLSQPDIDLQPAAKAISQFVDAAGKEAAAKRQRLRLVISLAEEFYRAALVVNESGQQPSDADLKTAVGTAGRWMSSEAPATCLEICLDAYGHIDANVNQATFIEWWLDALTVAGRTGLLAA